MALLKSILTFQDRVFKFSLYNNFQKSASRAYYKLSTNEFSGLLIQLPPGFFHSFN